MPSSTAVLRMLCIGPDVGVSGKGILAPIVSLHVHIVRTSAGPVKGTIYKHSLVPEPPITPPAV